jgi:hypothetical protein
MRATTLYNILVTDGDSALLEELVAESVDRIETQTTREGRPLIQIRVANDEAALATALRICNGHPFDLWSGYGIHRREVRS